ncbi:MAG: M20/M25/M40 family metallo-hydrolase [Chitinophagales bacterium]|nr:M20/M25/M40 family metallo-hydrolase [Chitinophagales bacterium]
MKKIYFAVFSMLLSIQMYAQESDSTIIRNIYTEILYNGKCYEWLHDLCKDVGHRLSGSPQADMSVRWAKETLDDEGFDKVWLQEVMVPRWIRGQKEYAEIIGVGQVEVLALGNSIATPEDGIQAQVIEVHNFDELEKAGEENIKGKIVFFNHYWEHEYINTFESYSPCVEYRWKGPSEAAKYGAVAVVVRSVSSAMDEFPHTGSMRYLDENKKIPAVAISTLDAELLSATLAEFPKTEFKLLTWCKFLPDVKSYNVIAEITGSEFPNEVITVGGHLDSWDVGEGAHDDGAGCVQSMEVLRTIKALNIKPKRTIRCVLFMNEENGNRGGHAYADWAKTTNEKHIAAMESDAGGFSPRGFTIEDDSDAIVKIFTDLKPLFLPYGVYYIQRGHGGTDIGPLKELGTTLIGLVPDSQRYMDIHHTANDTFDKVNKRELSLGAATMTSVVWWISENGIE